jgi:hypothetical protein
MRLVSRQHVRREPICFRVNGHAMNPQLVRGSNDSKGDFATIRY